MDKRTWYHTIEFPDGTMTPGYYDTREAPKHVPWPPSLSGSRCLDVGTFDGFWAFEMERRGAREVVALDVDDPDALDWPYDSRRSGPAQIREWRSERGPGFELAAGVLKSKVVRVNCSVYDLDPDMHGTFDVVLCGALLLHLRDPVRALEAMRGVCRDSLILVEALDPTLELFTPRVPAARFVTGTEQQWWLVNSAGLVELARKAGFQVERIGKRFLMPFGVGGSYMRPPRLHSLAARNPTGRGALHRAMRATPRPPIDSDQT